MNGRDFERVLQEAADSRVGRTGAQAVAACSAAWDSSVVVRVVRQKLASIAEWPVEDRVRLGALTIAWTGVGHLAGLFFLPQYVTSGLPRVWVVAVIAAALVVAAMPDGFARAWRERFRQVLTGSDRFRRVQNRNP